MRTFILFIFLLFGRLVVAQNCNAVLFGEISDFHDKTPLSGALIYATKTGLYTTSDKDGKFTLKNLCDGTLELEISHPECKTLITTVEVLGKTFKRITLEHHIEELSEVRVAGSLIKRNTNSEEEVVLKQETLNRYSAATLGDALKEVTGVASLNTGSNIVKPVIHGLYGSRVLIINNGVRLQDMEWGDEHAPNVDINTAGSATVIKGAAALQYGGDAIGGVIVLQPLKIPKKDSLFGKTTITGNTNGRGGSANSNLTRSFTNGWFIKGQGTYKRFGDRGTKNYILSGTGNEEKAASISFGKQDFYQGFDAYYSYFNSKLGILAASHIGNTDDLIRAIESPVPLIIRDFTYGIDRPNQEITHHLGRLRFYKRFQGLGKLSLQYDYQHNQRFEFDVRVGSDRNTPALDLELDTHTLTADFNFDKHKHHRLNSGVMARYQNNFADPSTGVRRLIPDYDKYDFGAYFTALWFFYDQLTIDAGIRYDYSHIDADKFYRTSRWTERGYQQDFSDIIVADFGTQLLTNPIFTFHNFSGTIGGKYAFNSEESIRFNYSFAQRIPNPSELFSEGLHHSAARIELGDLRLNQETSHKFILSANGVAGLFGWEVSPYINFINNFIQLEAEGVEQTIRGAFPVFEYRQTDARLLGIDLSTKFKLNNKFSFNNQFSFVKGNDIKNDSPLFNIPQVNTINSVMYKNPKWHNISLNIESQYFFEQNETPENIMVFSPSQNQEVELLINDAYPSYHLFNFWATADVSLFTKNDLNIGFSANNIFNTSYRNYTNRQRYFADDLGRNIGIQLTLNY